MNYLQLAKQMLYSGLITESIWEEVIFFFPNDEGELDIKASLVR